MPKQDGREFPFNGDERTCTDIFALSFSEFDVKVLVYPLTLFLNNKCDWSFVCFKTETFFSFIGVLKLLKRKNHVWLTWERGC